MDKSRLEEESEGQRGRGGGKRPSSKAKISPLLVSELMLLWGNANKRMGWVSMCFPIISRARDTRVGAVGAVNAGRFDMMSLWMLLSQG